MPVVHVGRALGHVAGMEHLYGDAADRQTTTGLSKHTWATRPPTSATKERNKSNIRERPCRLHRRAAQQPRICPQDYEESYSPHFHQERPASSMAVDYI